MSTQRVTVHVMGTMDVTLTSYVESTTVETLSREWLEAAALNLLVLPLSEKRRCQDSGRPGQRRGVAGGDTERER